MTKPVRRPRVPWSTTARRASYAAWLRCRWGAGAP